MNSIKHAISLNFLFTILFLPSAKKRPPDKEKSLFVMIVTPFIPWIFSRPKGKYRIMREVKTSSSTGRKSFPELFESIYIFYSVS